MSINGNWSAANNGVDSHIRQACSHNSDVIMGAMVSQITGVSIVYSSACSGTDQTKHQSSASLAICLVIMIYTLMTLRKLERHFYNELFNIHFFSIVHQTHAQEFIVIYSTLLSSTQLNSKYFWFRWYCVAYDIHRWYNSYWHIS